MDSRLTFRPRLYVLKHPGTPKRSVRGLVDWPYKPVGASREVMSSVRLRPSARYVESAGKKSWVGSVQVVRTVNRHRWVRRVASGERVKRGQGTRHNDPVTSEEGMPFYVATLAVVA